MVMVLLLYQQQLLLQQQCCQQADDACWVGCDACRWWKLCLILLAAVKMMLPCSYLLHAVRVVTIGTEQGTRGMCEQGKRGMWACCMPHISPDSQLQQCNSRIRSPLSDA
jgi:hypothetical protein